MIDPTPFRRHPVLTSTEVIRAALEDLADVDPTYMRTEEKAEALRALTMLTSQLDALRLRVIAAAEDVAAERGDKRVADWVARETRCDKRAAHAQQTLAEALDARWTRIGGGVASGRVHLDQARVVVRSLEALPPEVGRETRRMAEEHLLGLCDEFGPRDLAKLGERVLAFVAPEVADEAERKALDAADRRAETRTRFTYKTNPDGSLDYSGTLPPVEGSILKTVLEARMSPRRRDQADGWTDPVTGQRLTAEQVRGEAFRDLINTLDPTALGQHGGKPVSVFVTTTLDSLTTGLGTAQLSTGETITAAQARRLACDAGLIPAVLGSKSDVTRSPHRGTRCGRGRGQVEQPSRLRNEGANRACRNPVRRTPTMPRSRSPGPTRTTTSSPVAGTTARSTTPDTRRPTTPTAPSPSTGARESRVPADHTEGRFHRRLRAS
jgi:hypothetical protein